jgi:hypothetical protein
MGNKLGKTRLEPGNERNKKYAQACSVANLFLNNLGIRV